MIREVPLAIGLRLVYPDMNDIMYVRLPDMRDVSCIHFKSTQFITEPMGYHSKAERIETEEHQICMQVLSDLNPHIRVGQCPACKRLYVVEMLNPIMYVKL